MVTNYFWEIFADVKIDCFHSLQSCSEMKFIIALQICTLIALLIALHHVKNGANRSSSL